MQCFVKQYGNYSSNGDHVNGKQTLGENIAGWFTKPNHSEAYSQIRLLELKPHCLINSVCKQSFSAALNRSP